MPDNEEDKRLVKVPPVPSDDKSKSEKEEFEEGKKKREDAEDTLARKKPVADEEDDLVRGVLKIISYLHNTYTRPCTHI